MVDKSNRDQGPVEPPPCMIYVDKEGAWFHNGTPIIRRELVLLFYQCLHLDEQGHYIIKFKDQVCRLEVEDTPFVVLRTLFVPALGDGERERFLLYLIDDTKEDLDPDTLSVGLNHVLYCKIRDKKFTARFLRSSYYQLAQHVQEEPGTGRYFVYLNRKKYYLNEESETR